MAKGDDENLATCLFPILALLEPLLRGVNGGLQTGAKDVGAGFDQLGNGIQKISHGAGTLVAYTGSGLGGTVASVPTLANKVVGNLQSGGLVGDVVTGLTGK